MKSLAIFASPMEWFTASNEGAIPITFRGRRIPEKLIGTSSLPYLLVVTYKYDVADQTRLPTVAQYQLLSDFERDSLDNVEAQQKGLLTFILTCNGDVRYFFYVKSIDDVVQTITSSLVPGSRVEFAATEDTDWREYRSFMAGMSE